MIPASKLSPYLDFVTKALGPLPSSNYDSLEKDALASRYAICLMDGKVWFAAPPAAIAVLAEAGQIFGTGSRARLKYTTLTVPVEQAQATLDSAVESGKLKKHFMNRVPMAESNFTVRHINEPTGQYFEPIFEVCDGYARTPRMAMRAYVQDPERAA